MSSQKFADLGEIRPNQQNFARKILGRNLTARIRPFGTSFTQKKYLLVLMFLQKYTLFVLIIFLISMITCPKNVLKI
jgi:hypothetical protein